MHQSTLWRRYWIITAVMTAFLLLVVGCVPGPRRGQPVPGELSGSIIVAGSTAMQGLVDEAAAEFMLQHKNVQITVQGGGSGTGLSQLQQGAIDIANSDVFAEEKEGIDASKLVDHRVAVVGFAAIVHPANPVDSLTKDDLIRIFTGEVTNWRELGGQDERIVIINRPRGSGTRSIFRRIALKDHEEIEGITQEASGTVRQMVAQLPGAISYLALPYLDGSVKPLQLNKISPTAENIANDKYPLWSYEHMYTRGQPSGVAKAFLDYILSDKTQEQLVKAAGYIPIADMKVTKQPPGRDAS